MKIIIEDTRKVGELQEEFRSMFPYLKIVFFAEIHCPYNKVRKQMVSDLEKTIGKCRTKRNKGLLVLVPEMTVAQLERHFSEIFGLSIEIRRRSGNVWIETTITKSWSLAMQNQQGELLTTYINNNLNRQ